MGVFLFYILLLVSTINTKTRGFRDKCVLTVVIGGKKTFFLQQSEHDYLYKRFDEYNVPIEWKQLIFENIYNLLFGVPT